jgi:hypothetical protein
MWQGSLKWYKACNVWKGQGSCHIATGKLWWQPQLIVDSEARGSPQRASGGFCGDSEQHLQLLVAAIHDQVYMQLVSDMHCSRQQYSLLIGLYGNEVAVFSAVL